MDALIQNDGRPSAPLAAAIMAPEDCTDTTGLRRLLGSVRSAVASGSLQPVVDLSRVRRMNARLLATVLLLAREVGRAGGRLRLRGPSDEFVNWASTFNVFTALDRRGLFEAANPPS